MPDDLPISGRRCAMSHAYGMNIAQPELRKKKAAKALGE
jgi:hypothetical protein